MASIGGERSGGRTRNPKRARVVFVVGEAQIERERITGALRGAADQVRQCATLTDVDAALLNKSDGVIVIAADSMPTAVLEAAIAELRLSDPQTAMLLCLHHRARTHYQLATLARAGLDDLVHMDEPDTWDRLRSEVSRRLTYALPVALVRQVVPHVEQHPRAYCAYCFRNAFRNLKVEEVAEWFQYDPTTVNRHLRKAGLRSVEHVVDHARVLHAAYRLDTAAADVGTIARLLDYRSSPAFAADVRRWSGRSPSELRARGAIQQVAKLIPRLMTRAGTGEKTNASR